MPSTPLKYMIYTVVFEHDMIIPQMYASLVYDHKSINMIVLLFCDPSARNLLQCIFFLNTKKTVYQTFTFFV